MPGTAAPPTPATDTVNVPGAVIVAEFMASLKVALIGWPTSTLTAPFAGTVEVTVGIVPVVNVHT